jgi:hypothetical protein
MKIKKFKFEYLSKDSLDWFIGFSEAEASFIVATNGSLHFVLTQGHKNMAILHEIQVMLGFGSINKQGARTFRYVVQDKEGMGNIIEIFNGRLILEKRKEELKRFIEVYNQVYGTSIEYIESKRMPTKEDAWLSGFTDGVGCFIADYIITKEKFQIRYIISQKEDLSAMAAVLDGQFYHNKSTYHDHISFVDLENSIGKNTQWVYEYFRKFPLKTTKKNSYHLWCYIRNKLVGVQIGKLKPTEYEGLKVLTKLINEKEERQK